MFYSPFPLSSEACSAQCASGQPAGFPAGPGGCEWEGAEGWRNQQGLASVARHCRPHATPQCGEHELQLTQAVGRCYMGFQVAAHVS